MTPAQRSTPAGGLVRLGAALAIVLGIFGMHALSHHGTTHVEPTAAIATALTGSMAPAAATVHAHHRSGSTPHSTTVTDGHARDRGDIGGTGHSLGGIVMLCVAMLTAAATLFGVLAFIRRVPRLWAVLHPAAAHLPPTSWLIPTGAGPPSVWQFSVIRC